MFGAGYFKGKVVAIMGAEHPLGSSLALRFSGFGATVIAIGEDEESLHGLARTNPEQIEPLALRSGRADVLGLLRDAWGDEPLDCYIDTSPISAERQKLQAPDIFAKSAGTAAALVRGIRNGQARAVLAMPAVSSASSPTETARHAGYTALVRQFGKECMPGRFCGAEVPGDLEWSSEQCLSIGDAIMMLVHPVSRAVAQGTVIGLALDRRK